MALKGSRIRNVKHESIHENMLGSEQEAECGEDVATVDICKV